MGSFKSRRAMSLPALVVAIVVLAPLASSPAAQAAGAGRPTVSTGASWAIGTSVELEGTVNPHGLATTYYFEYGPHENPHEYQTTPDLLHEEGAQKEKVSQLVTVGMQKGYEYRLVAHNSDGEKPGDYRIYTGAPKKAKKPTTKPTKNTFELSGPFQPVVVGGTFVLSGTLTGSGNAKREVVLQGSPYPYTAPFADIGAPILTGAGGGFSFRVAHLTASTRFRVAALGTPAVNPSASLTELATVRVTLHVQRSKQVKGLVRLYGTVSPAAVGSHVFFQLEHTPKPKQMKTEKPEKKPRSEESEQEPTFATKFGTVVKRATRSVSRFSLVVKIKDTGNYRAFVELAPGPLASGQSETILLQAAPAKKSKK